MYLLGIVLILVTPALIGIFWGAPLIARELETGTYRLAWNQSVTRTRWLAVKLTLTGLAAMAVTEALSLMYAWWADPIGKAIDARARGVGPLSGDRFSLDLRQPRHHPARLCGVRLRPRDRGRRLIRRAVPAMAVTLAIFAVAQVPMPLWVRPHIIPPGRTIGTVEAAQVNFGALPLPLFPASPVPWSWLATLSTRRGTVGPSLPSPAFPTAVAKFAGGSGAVHGQAGHPGGRQLPAC